MTPSKGKESDSSDSIKTFIILMVFFFFSPSSVVVVNFIGMMKSN